MLYMSVCISEIWDTCTSDHLPVLFTATVPCSRVTTSAPACHLHVINPLTTLQFSIAFEDSMLYTPDSCCDLGAEELTALFDSMCTDILDSVAPFKT